MHVVFVVPPSSRWVVRVVLCVLSFHIVLVAYYCLVSYLLFLLFEFFPCSCVVLMFVLSLFFRVCCVGYSFVRVCVFLFFLVSCEPLRGLCVGSFWPFPPPPLFSYGPRSI